MAPHVVSRRTHFGGAVAVERSRGRPRAARQRAGVAVVVACARAFCGAVRVFGGRQRASAMFTASHASV